MQVDTRQLHAAVDRMLASSEAMPAYVPGRSIVTSVYGGEFVTGYVLMEELARLQVSLPIEIFHRTGELTADQIELLRSPNPSMITVRQIQGNAKDFTTQYGTKAGWSTKIYALWESRYAENLWIDADNFPIVDPGFLFSDPGYAAKHCLFWRDVMSPDRANRYHDGAPIWPVFNVYPNDGEPFEAGQLLINKTQCRQQMRLVKHYADNCEIYYQFGGDTETFRMAWQHLHLRSGGQQYHINYNSDPNVPYGFMPYGPFHKGVPNQYNKWGGGTVMVQRDRTGRELFNHRNMNKMRLAGNVFNTDIANEEHYHRHVETLRLKLGEDVR